MKRKGWILGATLLLACGCQGMSHTETGLLGGAGLGAAAGALIGHATGNTESGALIGAGLGAAAGGLTGHAIDRAEQRAEQKAVDRMRYEQAVAASRMTLQDVIQMAQNHVSDDLIIETIRRRGATFNLTANDVITLRQQGVSERVVSYMMQARPVVYQPAVVEHVPVVRREIIYHEVPPPSYIGIGFGYGYGCRPWHHRHCW